MCPSCNPSQNKNEDIIYPIYDIKHAREEIWNGPQGSANPVDWVDAEELPESVPEEQWEEGDVNHPGEYWVNTVACKEVFQEVWEENVEWPKFPDDGDVM